MEQATPFTHYETDHTIEIDAGGTGVVTRHFEPRLMGTVQVQVEGF